MRAALVSNPIKISDGNWGEFVDLAGVMKELMSEVVEYLKSKGRKFLEDIQIYYGINKPFDRNTDGDHQDNFYNLDDDLDNIYVKIELSYKNAKKTYDSFYLKIYSTEVRNNRHEVLRFFRIADHFHQEKTLGKKVNSQLPKGNSKIIDDGMRWELVAFSAEEIREAIQEAVDKLNKFIEDRAEEIALEKDNVEEMVSDISSLSNSK